MENKEFNIRLQDSKDLPLDNNFWGVAQEADVRTTIKVIPKDDRPGRITLDKGIAAAPVAKAVKISSHSMIAKQPQNWPPNLLKNWVDVKKGKTTTTGGSKPLVPDLDLK